MSTQVFSNIYLFNPHVNQQQLHDAIHEKLAKAEALAIIATTHEFEVYPSDIINNYLWALCDCAT